jgi:putative CocE/NonD family hydrolase
MSRSVPLALFLVLDLALPPTRAAAQAPAADFAVTEAAIPMRDGMKLFTVILAPKNAAESLPILMLRTPYGTQGWAGTPRFMVAFKELIADGYIFVIEDIRGRYRSEGQFVMNRPLHDPADPKGVDESTDTYDTIDWLVKHVPRNNGRVGVLGISYPGWLAAMAGINPHPALKAISPQAPMTDAWMGDDFFHQGTFRLSYGLEYAWMMEETADESTGPRAGRYDTYDWYRSFPTLGALAKAVGAMRFPTWRNFTAHPSYDGFWKGQALTTYLTQLRVPTLTVGGWWDQEDMYGPLTTYATLERHDTAGVNHLVMGPWSHGQWSRPGGDHLGNVAFGSNTADEFRARIQAPWFAYWLKGKGDGKFAEAQLFESGDNRWRSFDAWPPRNAVRRNLYLLGGGRLSFDPPADTAGFDAYVSDPAHPVPYRPRPVELTYDPRGSHWAQWMTEDQRFVDNRPDVLTWQTGPLDEDVTIAGDIVGRLFASTTGADADWVVKLIDVYPDTVADRPAMGGYELMVAGDVLRGRYRKSFERAEPIPAGAVEPYAVDLHQQLYRFQRGHRIMVQVQSTWFPLYDRNPQTWVDNIFLATAEAYRAQTHRVYRTGRHPSHVEVMVLPDSR